MRHLLREVMIKGPLQAREKAETDLRRRARQEAMRTASGLGGVKDVAYHTPRPWRYETSFARKTGWVLCWVIDRFVLRQKSPSYALPLKSDEYARGRRIVLHSGIEIKRIGDGETTTFARAYFDPYPRHP